MTRIRQTFDELRLAERKAFIPFVVAGDPDLAITEELLRAFDREGCAIAELGVPYSDPIADGPVIQAAYTNALRRQIKVSAILEMLARVAPGLRMPVVAMMSYAIVDRRGPRAFAAEAKASGLSGLIIPDLPLDEADEMSRLCRDAGLDWIPLITPTTSPERALRILQLASGFVYFVTVAGVTGERMSIPESTRDRIRWLREHSTVPIVAGFGISRPDHVVAMAEVADGVIVGSAIVRTIGEADGGDAKVHAAVEVTRRLMAPLVHRQAPKAG